MIEKFLFITVIHACWHHVQENELNFNDFRQRVFAFNFEYHTMLLSAEEKSTLRNAFDSNILTDLICLKASYIHQIEEGC